MRKPRHELTLRKKLAFTAVTLLLLAAPTWLLLEVIYRVVYSIPLAGGIVGLDDGRPPDISGNDISGNRALTTGFRRSENPILFYELTPGARTQFYSINSVGFRDREYSLSKDPAVFRIAVLGDSIVFGHGLDLQDTFSKQLESMMNEDSDQKFEVLNFGVSGYSTQQEVELFRVKAKRFDPDLVIVGYCLNDFEESSAEGDAMRRLSYSVFRKSYLYDHIRRVIAGVSYNQFGYMADAPPAQFDLHEQFRLLQSYCQGRRNLVVVFPVLEDFEYYLYTVDHHRIRDALRGLNYDTLDLFDSFRGFDPESLILDPSDRTHPNAFGTRLAARATLDLLAEKQLAPIGRDSISTETSELAAGSVASPESVNALKIAAGVHASKERFQEAAEIAITLSALIVPDRAGELLRAFDWHLRAGDPPAAEEDLRRAIELAPDDPRAHRALAQLLNSQGRRYEANRHTLSLARSGAITPRELLSLIDLISPFQMVSFDQVVGQLSDTLFDLGEARDQDFAGEPKAALKTIDHLALSKPNNAVIEAFRGRLIAELSDHDRFVAWIGNLPARIGQHPEYWLAIGTWLSHNDRDQEAVRAFGEALWLDPTDRRSLRLLASALNRLGEHEHALRVQETLSVLDKVYRLAANADAEQAIWIAGQLQTLTRPWESVAWYRYGFLLQGTIETHADELNQRVAQIRDWENAAETAQIRDARVMKMLGFNVRKFPMPEFDSNIVPRADIKAARRKSTLRFEDVAQSVGIKTSFVSDYPLDAVDFYLYQANGGGLAALDYDLDGRCDLYVVQSGGDPNKTGSSVANQLFRQLPGEAFLESSGDSLTDDRGYGQGVCAGDVNQDGLPDLLVANIGKNVVYINQGDGTFRERSELIIENSERWTSSLAMGDLDGDSLPDIIEVNYLDDPLIFQQKCVGRALNCTPQRFRAATDRILRCSPDGTFRSWRGAQQMDELPNYGFGALIADFDRRNGNELFVSNDGDLNHYWKSLPPRTGQPAQAALIESAGVAGCSIGTSGNSQACMGIASGDFDRNGLLDLLVTNFHNEPVNLFLQNDSGFFVDEALKYALVEPTTGTLGFGTQAADFDNDGWLDVAISNGHIYDARYAGIPFRMNSQLLRGGPGAFSLQDPETAGPYWSRHQLARTLALFDWNRDGRMDLVANHLDQPLAILQNESETENWLQVELIGVTSDRDAVGAHVTVHAGDERWTGWQTGGDGFMCTNEPVIHFGIGSAKMIDRIEIVWPSGRSQTVRSINANKRYLMIEGEDALHPR